ncbi:type II toxin-antitoxin system RelE/ParE family toxin [Brucella pituitosa]|uniref:type II toxin-antitoxin system RelE/ParE family toxin n=1 Tax=Brucella pituitosa TaxID=571256 RepID=UPI003F4AA951
MRLVWTRQVHNDRKEIREHIARDNPVAALKLDELVSENVSRLVAYPQLGRSGRVRGTRELVAHQNSIVIYDIDADFVRLLRILHAR